MSGKRPNGDGMIRKRKDGRWEGRIVVGHKNDHSPIHKYVVANTQTELLTKLNRLKETYRDIDLNGDYKITFEEWFYKWIDIYKKNVIRDSTIEKYEYCVRKKMLPFIGNENSEHDNDFGYTENVCVYRQKCCSLNSA